MVVITASGSRLPISWFTIVVGLILTEAPLVGMRLLRLTVMMILLVRMLVVVRSVVLRTLVAIVVVTKVVSR